MVYIPDSNLTKRGREIIYCKHCLMPSSRPRIMFDQEGVCNACRHAENKSGHIDWDARKKEFLDIVEKYRAKDGSWDCVVPWSGGKDSSSIAHRLKYDYGLNPLLVTYSPMIPNEVGEHNCEALIRAGFDRIMLRSNQKAHRRLAKRFFIERGNPKVAWDAGINAAPMQVAVRYCIPLVFYAEHGESEYGGRVLHEDSAKRRDFTEVIEHQIGDDPSNWVDTEISMQDLQTYLYPSSSQVEERGIIAYYFAYFHKWSMFENYEYIKDKIDFRINPRGRTTGTFTNFDSLDDKMDPLYYYMQFIKFGFGRAVRDGCRLIQNGHMSRTEALGLAHKYDGEFPDEHLDEVLEYLDMTEAEFHQVVDKHRNPEIWKREGDAWTLRFPLPEK